MHKWIDVAVLTKKKNVKGRFVARKTAGLFFLPEAGTEVAFVPPKLDVPRRAIVNACHEIDDKSFEISFTGIESASLADELIGMHCLVNRSLIEPSNFVHNVSSWLGFVVEDKKLGPLGVLNDVLDNPTQSLLVVNRADDKGEVLIPFVEEFIFDIDEQAKTITVSVPQGLLDL